ncbi:hypothetical protein [Bacteroides sp.]|uniref:hypothetical protein n=1 Tax=Bacteroides sp. TaxID=29523 RepID=UPI003D11BBAE
MDVTGNDPACTLPAVRRAFQYARPYAVFPAVNHCPIERPLCIIFRVGFIVGAPGFEPR